MGRVGRAVSRGFRRLRGLGRGLLRGALRFGKGLLGKGLGFISKFGKFALPVLGTVFPPLRFASLLTKFGGAAGIFGKMGGIGQMFGGLGTKLGGVFSNFMGKNPALGNLWNSGINMFRGVGANLSASYQRMQAGDANATMQWMLGAQVAPSILSTATALPMMNSFYGSGY